MKKTIFIIPGFRHTPSQKAYKTLASLLKKEGYFPIPVIIPWQHRTISENTEYFLKEYKKIRRSEKHILGFSYGAMIALIASTKVDVSGLILCSLSPFFKEDVYQKKSKQTYQYADFSRLHFGRLAGRIKAKQILMLYGAKEEKSLIKRVNEAYYQIPSSHKYLMPIQKTEHDIGDKRYLQKIQYATKQLY